MPTQSASIYDEKRFFTSPHLLQLGHTNVNPEKPDAMYMDDHTVRCRAGILNICSVVAFMYVAFLRIPVIAWILYPLLCLEFAASGTVGLTPLAPIGLLASVITPIVHPEPLWKPAPPKRFAWAIGFTLVNMCFVGFLLDIDFLMYLAVGFCYVATWLEACLGFCMGCFIYNRILIPFLGRVGAVQPAQCDECENGVCPMPPKPGNTGLPA